VIAVGPGVTRFKPGDAVCGLARIKEIGALSQAVSLDIDPTPRKLIRALFNRRLKPIVCSLRTDILDELARATEQKSTVYQWRRSLDTLQKQVQNFVFSCCGKKINP
jgi:NADPH:quinone reductase-like Zn-dependent oxidoreductase